MDGWTATLDLLMSRAHVDALPSGAQKSNNTTWVQIGGGRFLPPRTHKHPEKVGGSSEWRVRWSHRGWTLKDSRTYV